MNAWLPFLTLLIAPEPAHRPQDGHAAEPVQLSGRVLCQTRGRPLGSAFVAVLRFPKEGEPILVAQAPTSDEGTFELEVVATTGDVLWIMARSELHDSSQPRSLPAEPGRTVDLEDFALVHSLDPLFAARQTLLEVRKVMETKSVENQTSSYLAAYQRVLELRLAMADEEGAGALERGSHGFDVRHWMTWTRLDQELAATQQALAAGIRAGFGSERSLPSETVRAALTRSSFYPSYEERVEDVASTLATSHDAKDYEDTLRKVSLNVSRGDIDAASSELASYAAPVGRWLAELRVHELRTSWSYLTGNEQIPLEGGSDPYVRFQFADAVSGTSSRISPEIVTFQDGLGPLMEYIEKF